MDNEEQILVCCIRNTDTYVDYIIEEDVMKTSVEDGEIENLEFPMEALVSVQNINNRDLIQSISLM